MICSILLTVFLLLGVFVNTAGAGSITISNKDATLTIDDYGRISSFTIEGQEQMNEAYWYTSVRKTGSGNPYTAPLRVDTANYNVVEHVAAVGTDGWSLKVERDTAPSDIQFEYSGHIVNDIAGDGTASFSVSAFWLNENFLTTGNTDCDCYLFIDADLSGTPNNDIASLSNNNGLMSVSFKDQSDGVVFGFSVEHAVGWEIDNNLLLQNKLDNGPIGKSKFPRASSQLKTGIGNRLLYRKIKIPRFILTARSRNGQHHLFLFSDF